jgi:hypothetical protein
MPINKKSGKFDAAAAENPPSIPKPNTHAHYLYDITKARFISLDVTRYWIKVTRRVRRKAAEKRRNQKENLDALFGFRSLFANLIQRARSRSNKAARKTSLC